WPSAPRTCSAPGPRLPVEHPRRRGAGQEARRRTVSRTTPAAVTSTARPMSHLTSPPVRGSQAGDAASVPGAGPGAGAGGDGPKVLVTAADAGSAATVTAPGSPSSTPDTSTTAAPPSSVSVSTQSAPTGSPS